MNDASSTAVGPNNGQGYYEGVAGPEHFAGESGQQEVDRVMTKTPAGRGKGKNSGVDTTNLLESTDRQQQQLPRVVKREDSGSTSMPRMSPPRVLNEKGAGSESLLFGSGMILVKKLPDGSMNSGGSSTAGQQTTTGSSNDATRTFPPAQLSMRGGQAGMSQSEIPNDTPPTPTLKNKRSKALLNQPEQEPITTEAGSMSSPPPPPPPPVRGKAAHRARKGVAASSDADIERSNQITRSAAGSSGPAWMTAALTANTATASPPSSSSFTSVTTTGGTIRKRLPLPPPQPSEADKRKPKRIKIDDKDDRQVQRTLSSSVMGQGRTSSVIGTERKKKKDKVIKKDDDSTTSQTRLSDIKDAKGRTSNARKRNGTVQSAEHEPERDGNETGADGDDMEEDEVMEEGERDQSAPGSSKRRSPEDEDPDNPNEGDSSSAMSGSGSTSNCNGHKHGGAGGRRGGGRAGGTGANAKNKSSTNEGATATESHGPSDNVSGPSNKKTASSSPRGENSAQEGGQRKMGDVPITLSEESESNCSKTDSSKGKKKKGKKIKVEKEESDTEIEYLPMEDDIRCPNMFGLEGLEYGLEKESSDNEGEDDDDDDDDDDDEEDDDDAKSDQQSDGKSGSSSKKANGHGKTESSVTTPSNTDVDDPIQIQGREWVTKLSMTEDAWIESFKTYERVKRLKELKNRQPVRKRDAILAAILYIVCRNMGAPRTFSEICTASGVKRGDIGSYYRLMLKVLEPTANPNASARDTDAEAFMTRWCESLALPPQVRPAAVHVFSQANTLNLTSGKCPSSVGAASIYLCIYSWNDARRIAHCQKFSCEGCWRGIPSSSLAGHNAAATLANGSAPSCTAAVAANDHPDAEDDPKWIRKEHKDVALAVGVVSATLMGCFKHLAPERARLIPDELVKVALED